MLQCAVKEAADVSFNMVSVDGDTSTNDTLAVLASGKAGNQEITEKSEDYQAFLEGLVFVCREISKLLAGDGEGATKLLICKVSGAKTLADAKGVAKSVDLLQPAEGRHVRRRRQLGTGAVRHRLFRL